MRRDAGQFGDPDHLRPDFARALVEAFTGLAREHVTRLPILQKLREQPRGRRPEGTNGLSSLHILELKQALVRLDLVDLEFRDFVAINAQRREIATAFGLAPSASAWLNASPSRGTSSGVRKRPRRLSVFLTDAFSTGFVVTKP